MVSAPWWWRHGGGGDGDDFGAMVVVVMVVLVVSNLFAKMDMVTEMYMHDPIPNISSGWGGVG